MSGLATARRLGIKRPKISDIPLTPEIAAARRLSLEEAWANTLMDRFARKHQLTQIVTGVIWQLCANNGLSFENDADDILEMWRRGIIRPVDQDGRFLQPPPRQAPIE